MASQSPRIVRLRDGRRLSFDDCGDGDGTPIFYFHGNGNCRLGRHPDDQIAERLGVRLIAVDRPGSGRSSFQPHRRMLDWGADIEELADALAIPKFGILGWSSGGPYAAACAYRMPDRVVAVSIVSGLAPLDTAGATAGMETGTRFLLLLARASPLAILGPLAVIRGGVALDPSRLISLLFAESPSCDRAILKQPEIRQMFIRTYRETVRGGTRALAHEVCLLPQPWGFMLRDVSVPVTLYHGDMDTVVPLRMARYVADCLPLGTLRVFPGEAHQLIWPRWKELLAELEENTRHLITMRSGSKA